jgi:hypothetical protein
MTSPIGRLKNEEDYRRVYLPSNFEAAKMAASTKEGQAMHRVRRSGCQRQFTMPSTFDKDSGVAPLDWRLEAQVSILELPCVISEKSSTSTAVTPLSGVGVFPENS